MVSCCKDSDYLLFTCRCFTFLASINTIELSSKETVYTYQTLENLYNEHDDVLFYFIMGADSLFYFEKSLSSLLQTFGFYHPFIATCCFNIGCIYSGQKNRPKAAEYLRKSLLIKERIFGKYHPDTIKVKNEIDRINQNNW